MVADVPWASVASLLVAVSVWLLVPQDAARRLSQPVSVRAPGWFRTGPGGPATAPRAVAGGALAAAVALWSGHLGVGAIALGLLAGVLGFVLPGLLVPADRARRERALTAALPQACELLAVSVEAGLPLRAAVEAVAPTFDGPLGDALAGFAARVRLGMPEGEAWTELGAEPALRGLSRELARTAPTGVGVARVLRELAADSRRSHAADALVRAKRVGVRSVLPLMACFLPSFVLLGIVPVIGGIVAGLFR